LLTNRRDLAAAARRFRDGGRREGAHVAYSEGINSRLDELQAALLRVSLRHLRRWNRQRAALAARYDRWLEGLPPETVQRLPRNSWGNSANHLYVIRASRRDALRNYLLRQGIETAIHYAPPLHLQPGFGWLGYRKGDFPHAERAAREILSLPLHPLLTRRQADRIAAHILRFYQRR
ncbi:MAG TPA: DegT/DnrJ/EryC1/StrS family aminotransferase, partial [Terriglobia bacterium]|nr:DegT/DnrJ/EryC1/StrS family aminotransferase [Terriglobia bacterium]